MDPANGASTWALGNQICRKYIGNLTKKADIMQIVISILMWGELDIVKLKNCSFMERELLDFRMEIIIINRGRDLKMV